MRLNWFKITGIALMTVPQTALFIYGLFKLGWWRVFLIVGAVLVGMGCCLFGLLLVIESEERADPQPELKSVP